LIRPAPNLFTSMIGAQQPSLIFINSFRLLFIYLFNPH